MQTSTNIMAILAEAAVPFLLVVLRVAGIFLTTPMLSGALVLPQYRVLLAVMLGAAVYPSVSGPGLAVDVSTDVFGLIPLVVSEAAIGFTLGMMVSLPLLALEAAGAMSGHQMGIALGRVYNPAADEDADVVGQLLYFAGLTVFFASGGLDRTVGAIMASFTNVPVGAFAISSISAQEVSGLVASGIELVLRVSSPVTAIVLLLSATFGAVGKTMPQVNIMSVGFSAKAFGGLAMLAFSSYAGHEAGSEEIFSAVDGSIAWMLQLGS